MDLNCHELAKGKRKMNLEQLKQMLANGEITQEEFDKKVQELEGKKDDKGGTFDIKTLFENEDFKTFLNKTIQSETDKVRTEKTKVIKTLEEELNNLKTKNMTDEERFEQEKQKYLEEKQQFVRQQLDFETLKLINQKKMDDDILQFINGKDIDERKTQIELFEKKVQEVAANLVKQKLGEGERDVNTKGFDAETITEAEFSKLTIEKQAELIEKFPSLEQKFLG